MKKAKKQKSATAKKGTCKQLLQKAAQGAVVLGTLNIGLTALAADSPMVQKQARDMAAQGLVDPSYNNKLTTDPAGAMGKHPDQLTDEDRAAAAQAQQKIRDVKRSGASGGGCGMAKSIPNP